MDILLGVSLFFGTILFSLLFYRKLRFATYEYETSKDIVQAVSLTNKKRIDNQNEKIEKIEYDIENIQSLLEQYRNDTENNQEQIEKLLTKITSILFIDKKISENILSLNQKINSINFSYKNKTHLIQSDTKTQINNKLQQNTNVHTQQFNLTTTEQLIVHILLNEGPKTAPQIQQKIEKTREHTSRLLKKLWQEGYIDRDTHSIPYNYRPSNELINRMNSLSN